MKIVRVLTIGNSFAVNALTCLEDLGKDSARVEFHCGRANLGGCSLEKHWNLAQYTARHPEHKTYRIAIDPTGQAVEGSLQMALAAEPWDYVTLQQVSSKSWLAGTFQPYLGNLIGLVRERAPQARIMLHQTWAYRADSPFLPQNGLTQELMFARIKDAYDRYASEFGCGILPSGAAIQRARRAPGRAFAWLDPDFQYHGPAAAPALPCQDHSLAAGWRWAINDSPEGIPELHLDPNHLNASGCYLAGCVWLEKLTGHDARKIRFRPAAMDDDTAAFLRATAHAACREGAG